jgi:deazaflavin-dependent oxidoreductase (nitroreductase family)
MMRIMNKRLFRIIKRPPQVLYAIGLGPFYGRLVLLLTTTGRKTGRARVTPLQYEEIDGTFQVASALGRRADWFRNIEANPNVRVRVGRRDFPAVAEPITDVRRVADFLEYRLRKHPRMVGAIMRREGLPRDHDRSDLEAYAARRTMVIIREALESGQRGE